MAGLASNNSFNPNPLRSTNNMADKTCHVVGSTTQVGLTQALGVMKLALLYWKFFNFVLRRIVAVGFMLIGLVVAFSQVRSLIPNGNLDDGVPSGDLTLRILAVGLPLLVSVFGVFLFRAKPYYPQGVAGGSRHDT